jgi:hypothetical protein
LKTPSLSSAAFRFAFSSPGDLRHARVSKPQKEPWKKVPFERAVVGPLSNAPQGQKTAVSYAKIPKWLRSLIQT